MIRSPLSRLCATLALLMLALLPLPGGAQTTLLVAYEDKEQPPYYLENSGVVPAQLPGVAVEMVRLLETRIPGLSVRLVRYPWKRCLDQLEHGRVDAIFNASYLPERAQIGAYPLKGGEPDTARRLTTISYALYTLRESPIRWNGSAFLNAAQARFGAPLGYSIVNDMRAKGLMVTEAPNTVSVLQQLLFARIDAALLQSVTADAFIAADPARFSGIVKQEPPVASKAYFLMLSHQFQNQNPALSERIWNEIGHLREAELPHLIGKYNTPQ